jgi:hypothetical protein
MSNLSDSENEVHIVGESWNVGCVRLSFLRNSENARTRSHSFPQSSATLLANKGEDLLGLKRHGSWKSSGAAENYIEDCVENKIQFAKKILHGAQIKNFRNQRLQCVIKKTRKIRGMKILSGKSPCDFIVVARKTDYKICISFQKVPTSCRVFNFCLHKNYYNNWLILNKFTYRSRTPKLLTVEFIVSNE